MVHDNIVNTWVYEHYLIYLSLSIADSDCLITDKELEDIRCKSLPSMDPQRCTSLIKEVYREFWSHTDEERRGYIKSFAPRFLRTDIIRNKVIQHLQTIINGKDEESEEYIMFRFIRKVINNTGTAAAR